MIKDNKIIITNNDGVKIEDSKLWAVSGGCNTAQYDREGKDHSEEHAGIGVDEDPDNEMYFSNMF